MATSAPVVPTKTFQTDALTVQIYGPLEQMAQGAAQAAQDHLQAVLAKQPRAAVIFACAPSQIKFLQCLANLGGVDWSRVTVLHMDEYLGLSENHPASFRLFLREHVVRPLKPGAVHYLEGDAMQPLAECARYTGLLRAQPIDLCCLGIGENGHVAFNDPPVANFSDPHLVKLVKLDQACRQQQVGEGHFPNLDAVPQYAFTLTVPALCSAKRMICVAPEKRKAQAAKDALRGPITTACPASFLRKQPQATLFLDAGSASLL